MPSHFPTPTLVCRPALPKDTPDALALVREIWDGEDYIPQVWTDWLADPEGLLAVAEYEGAVAGLGKLTRLGAEEWWLEGLRVHPRLQGRGIASHLHGYFLEIWQRKWGGILRLATSSERIQVHRLCERTGFTRIGEVTQFTAPSLPRERSSFRPVQNGEIDAALDIDRQSPTPAACAGLIDLGWQWAAPARAHWEGAVADHRAWVWRRRPIPREPANAPGAESPTGFLLIDMDNEGDAEVPFISLLACPEAVLTDILLDIRRLAGLLGHGQISWKAPQHAGLAAALQEAGYRPEWYHHLYLYEKKAE